MTVHELRSTVTPDTVLWIETSQEEYCEAGEAARLSHKYDHKTIKTIYPEHYQSLYCTGITIQI